MLGRKLEMEETPLSNLLLVVMLITATESKPGPTDGRAETQDKRFTNQAISQLPQTILQQQQVVRAWQGG